jgi:hypothetical protein
MRTDDPKPTLHLLPGASLTFEQALDLLRELTGREPTEAELAQARAVWERELGGEGESGGEHV